MKNKSIIIGIIALVAVGGITLLVTKSKAPSNVADSGVYCSSDSTLTSAKSIQSHRSYCLKTDSIGKTYAINTPSEYSFSIVDDQGNTLKNFEITHTKLMHVIVARKDLVYFQHVHPEFDQSTGMFTFKDLTFPADGVYRIFADFAPGGGQKDSSGMPLPVTLSEDVLVGIGANYTPQMLGSEERLKTFDSYQVTLSTDKILTSGTQSRITFNLIKDSKPVTDLQGYLGALGHSVILHEGNLDFIHAHPMEDVTADQDGKVDFMVDFPEAGKYKIFTQFQRSGKVFTTNFVVSVGQGANSSGGSMKGLDHSMH